MEVQNKKVQKIKFPSGGATTKKSSLFLGSLVFGRIYSPIGHINFFLRENRAYQLKPTTCLYLQFAIVPPFKMICQSELGFGLLRGFSPVLPHQRYAESQSPESQRGQMSTDLAEGNLGC